MTQKGFEDYIYTVYSNKTGTAKSYITAIRIIDEMFEYDDVFQLNGRSVTSIDDLALLIKIVDFVFAQQSLYKKGEDSIFRNVNNKQVSYPGKGFCSAAIHQLQDYFEYEKNTQADFLFNELKEGHSGEAISKQLNSFFGLDKMGDYRVAETKVRIGQSYFRKKVLENYKSKCCVTGLDVVQILRASHISAWAEDAANRLNLENGLCLSATYDVAFDEHLISFDEDYRMIVSKYIKNYYTNEVTKEYFNNFEGKSIIMPTHFLPSQKLLAKHRELLVS